MVILIRSLKVASPEAMQWAKDISDYVNDAFPGHNVRAHREWFGASGSIHWIVEYGSVAEIEQLSRELEADEGYLNMVADSQSRGLFVPGSLQDTIVEEL